MPPLVAARARAGHHCCMPENASTSDLIRRIESLIRVGTIAEVAYNPLRCRVTSGKLTTDWLPCFTSRAGNIRTWSPPSVGEQCIVVSPGGDMAAGLVLVGLNSTAYPAPEDSPDTESINYPDGAVIRYDHAAHALTATLPAGGTADITAPAGVTVHSDAITLDAQQTTVTGALTVQGLLTYEAGMAGSGSAGGASAVITGGIQTTEDVVAGSISLMSHTHPGDSGGTTGAPQ